MVSSPKDQKQGDSTEKQADPISIYNQLDHRHKQKSACQAVSYTHLDVYKRQGFSAFLIWLFVNSWGGIC